MLAEVLRELAADHEALEIDGQRRFEYESDYFDTPDLRCFVDHAQGRHPRFKIRTRLYVDSGRCEFEVKVARADDDTVKHSIDQDRDGCGSVTGEGESLVSEVTDIAAPGELERVLRTEFARMTLAATGAAERVTIDLAVRLTAAAGGCALLDDDLALVETKTHDGDGRCDELMSRHGVESVSLSKYRFGVGALVRPDADERYVAERARFFSVSPK